MAGSARGASFLQKMGAVLVALALCIGLAPTVPALAWGDEGDATFSVALTVVDTTDPVSGIVRNVRVDGMTSAGTVADLLAAAGFTAGDQGASAADPQGVYYDSWGSPAFAGKGYDGATGSYWVTMFDGDSANYASAQLSASLQANGHYQYIYTNGSTFEYTDEISKLVLDAVNNPLPNSDPDPVPDPDPEPKVPVTLDESQYRSLFVNIAASFAGTSDEWEALDLAAIGKASDVDASKLVETALDYDPATETTALQRAILSLTAVGIDAAAVPSADGGTVDLVGRMAASQRSHLTSNAMMFVLLAYESGPYEVPSNAVMSKQDLIDHLLSAQLADGGFSYSGSSGESDMTAMAIASLAPHRDNPDVAAAIESALGFLRTAQLPNGGFSSAYDADPTAVNVSSTAFVIVALSALGIDPAADAEWTTASGATPMSALLSMANSDLTGFSVPAGYDQALADEQGFRALAAYQGLKNTGAAYNIYTQAKYGQAGLTGTQAVSDNGAGNNATSSLAATGDPAAAAAVAAGALALCAAAGFCCAARAGRLKPMPAKAKDHVR